MRHVTSLDDIHLIKRDIASSQKNLKTARIENDSANVLVEACKKILTIPGEILYSANRIKIEHSTKAIPPEDEGISTYFIYNQYSGPACSFAAEWRRGSGRSMIKPQSFWCSTTRHTKETTTPKEPQASFFIDRKLSDSVNIGYLIDFFRPLVVISSIKITVEESLVVNFLLDGYAQL